MTVRGHDPVVFSQLKGLWDRGDVENTPLDHFADCNNLIAIGNNITVRPGVGLHQSVAIPLEDVRRIYNYPTATGNTILALVVNDDDEGEIYHVVNPTTVYGPILTIAGMTDFAFVPYAGRAYISPFKSFTTGDLNIEKGMQNEFLYVYLGAGVPARKAGGTTPAGTLTIAAGTGNSDPGLHLYGVVGESDSGAYSGIYGLTSFTNIANMGVSFGTVPVLVGAQWVKRHIVAAKAISGTYSGNTSGYEYYFIPTATINNNTDAFLNNVSFFDIDLIESASHLFDNYTEIPAGAAMWLYHERLCIAATFTDISLILISAPGEPEAISQIDGLLIVPPDGNPITNGAELRDIMYVFKRSQTTSYTDTGEEPANWPDSPIDPSLGTSVHGIATVLDSGKSSVDYFIICTYAGIMLFNGKYILPELSWKIQQRWRDLDRNEFRKIQIINALIQKWILIVLPNGTIMVGDWNSGMDPKNIKWFPWTFNIPVNCLAIVNIDQIIIGSPIYDGGI